MRNRLVVLAAAWAVCSWSVVAQTPPGLPEDNGLTPKTDTIYINVPPDSLNNASTESLGVAREEIELILRERNRYRAFMEQRLDALGRVLDAMPDDPNDTPKLPKRPKKRRRRR